MIEKLQALAATLNKYRWAITLSLFVCCIMQQCTISQLRNEIAFLKDKYEMPAEGQTVSRPLAHSTPAATGGEQATGVSDSQQSAAQEQPADTAKAYDNSKPRAWVYVAGGIAAAIALYILAAWYFSLWPFTIKLNGKIWQDLNGRVIYTLSAKNKGRKDVTIDNAMIEFINIKERRKFKMPLADLPLTLSKGTSHTVNIPLQKLLESHRELMEYKMIRVNVECNKKLKSTFPLGVRWK